MMNQAQWGQMKVGDFFRGYNWQGAPPVLECSVKEESLDNLPSLLCLSVTDFFTQANWTGQPPNAPEDNLPALHRPKAPPRPLSLTASVAEFCRGIDWQGQGLSRGTLLQAKVPVQSREPVAKLEPTIGLEDLSDLF